ncbi:late competence protein ComER [Cohnella sp. CFH 77786]|uniref:late competence protein ComER n=1 Tax=Cohnella sp. CFH 77786 TaxID=2662265 RepID=UPI001C610D3B|nr:late competence protein ComER [Cohnella sp. CFH 77786]MBW5444958.1 late competence protein ComER [Cohnella sp. CFH 77786]
MKRTREKEGRWMKVGFIGTGSMGSLLVGAFIDAGAMLPANVAVSSRTPSKAEALTRRYPGLRLAPSNADAARDADLLFLCVKPSDFRAVLTEIAPVLHTGQIAVSITSPVKLEQLERALPCKVAKVIPSIVNKAKAGASLAMWGTRLAPEDRNRLTELFSTISRPVEIREDDVRAASDISSCGPAFFAFLLGEFADAAVRHAGMERGKAETLAAEMLLGTARLLVEQGFSTQELQTRVSVPGGITAAALDALRASTAEAFPSVFRVTHEKFAEDLAKVEASLRESGDTEKGGSP